MILIDVINAESFTNLEVQKFDLEISKGGQIHREIVDGSLLNQYWGQGAGSVG